MKRKCIGYSHGQNAVESRNRAEKREEKRLQIGLAEDLLKTHEALPDDDRDYDYERHLRAKVRQKKNELSAMGDSDMKLEDF